MAQRVRRVADAAGVAGGNRQRGRSEREDPLNRSGGVCGTTTVARCYRHVPRAGDAYSVVLAVGKGTAAYERFCLKMRLLD